MSKSFVATIAGLLALAGALTADSVGGIRWEAPKSWRSQPKPMRAANYVVPAAAGDPEDGECAVYYFGRGQGGGVEANIKRWISQFRAPGGGSIEESAKISRRTINGVRVTLLDVSGTYLFRPSPRTPHATPKPGFRMLAAIAEGTAAPIFFKLTAPAKTAAAAEEDFRRMVDSIAEQDRVAVASARFRTSRSD